MKNLLLHTAGAARASSRNHHLGLQTQTWEEAEHKDWPQCSTQGWEEPIQDVGITTYPHKWLLSKFPGLQADQDSEDQEQTSAIHQPSCA